MRCLPVASSWNPMLLPIVWYSSIVTLFLLCLRCVDEGGLQNCLRTSNEFSAGYKTKAMRPLERLGGFWESPARNVRIAATSCLGNFSATCGLIAVHRAFRKKAFRISVLKDSLIVS